MDATKLFVKTHGYVKTLFGRVCHYPDATSSNPSQRAAIERQAINAPIQGTAADIIRRAMIRMEDALEQAGLGDVRMLLQVHDELVFEAPEAKVERALPIIRKVMVDAPHPAVTLKVPLQVDARGGRQLGRGALRARPWCRRPYVTARQDFVLEGARCESPSPPSPFSCFSRCPLRRSRRGRSRIASG